MTSLLWASEWRRLSGPPTHTASDRPPGLPHAPLLAGLRTEGPARSPHLPRFPAIAHRLPFLCVLCCHWLFHRSDSSLLSTRRPSRTLVLCSELAPSHTLGLGSTCLPRGASLPAHPHLQPFPIKTLLPSQHKSQLSIMLCLFLGPLSRLGGARGQGSCVCFIFTPKAQHGAMLFRPLQMAGWLLHFVAREIEVCCPAMARSDLYFEMLSPPDCCTVTWKGAVRARGIRGGFGGHPGKRGGESDWGTAETECAGPRAVWRVGRTWRLIGGTGGDVQVGPQVVTAVTDGGQHELPVTGRQAHCRPSSLRCFWNRQVEMSSKRWDMQIR